MLKQITMKNRSCILLLAIFLWSIPFQLTAEKLDSTRLDRFEDQIRQYEQQDIRDFPLSEGILFTGSSSVRMWQNLEKDLAGLPVLNRGFGGATLPEVNYYADRVIYPYQPQIVAVYAGDNDVAMGYSPEEILENYKILAENIHQQLPEARLYFIAIKPSPSRWELWPVMSRANQLVEDYSAKIGYLNYLDTSTPMLNQDGTVMTDIFLNDNLHMNQKGYATWTNVVKPEMEAAFSGYDLWLPRIFADHMVLQRDQPIRIWGRANPKETIKVNMGQQDVTTMAAEDGTWQAYLAPSPAGGPFQLTISGESRQKAYTNVMLGDVWIASGQSNMEWNLSWEVNNYEQEIARADYPQIRLYTVPKTVSHVPLNEVTGGSWASSSPENVGSFSAVAYFFARHIHQKQGVPIGIIHSSWGGTPAEAWTSYDMLYTLPSYQDRIDKMYQDPVNYAALMPEINRKQKLKNQLIQTADQGLQQRVISDRYDDSKWETMSVPNNWADTELKSYDGFVWFRKEIELPASFNQQDLLLSLGRIAHNDVTYFNGKEIGSSSGNQEERLYQVDQKSVKKGKNIIAVRVLNLWGQGGFIDQPEDMFIQPRHIESAKISLAGNWKYSQHIEPQLPVVPGFQNHPASLFNGMISPLIPLSMKGFIWYQGESNASRAKEYRNLFPAMIEDWRVRFQQGYLPFLFVQLANFMERKDQPSQDAWAELREAQLMTLDYPKTGMAVTIDIGNAKDIHPRNKQDVGKRLGLAAENIAYGKDIVHAGPLFDSMEINSNKILLHFKSTGDGLKTVDGEAPLSFEVAGPDQKFYWAQAKIIDKNTIELISPEVDQPEAVRYAWQSNPAVNLYNSADLPATPFRTDQWTGITE